MADLSITAANVKAGSNAVTSTGIAGESITAGMPVYKDTGASNKYKKCDTSTAAKSLCDGIALHASESGQPLTVQTEGDMDLGATLTVGTIYVLSDTAGKVCPAADNGSNDYVTILGVATATDNLVVNINVSGIAKV